MFGIPESDKDKAKRELTKDILYDLYIKGLLGGASTQKTVEDVIKAQDKKHGKA